MWNHWSEEKIKANLKIRSIGLMHIHPPVSLMLALLLSMIFLTSLFIGRYDISPYSVILILMAGFIDSAIGLLSWPASAFMPWQHALPPITDVFASLFGMMASLLHPMQHTWPSVMETVIYEVRLPRSLVAILVGSGLAISGTTFQGTFRNPLVSESILGVSAGASVGAALGILLDQNAYVIQLFAFGFGILAVVMTFLISRVYKSNPTLVLVLAGVIVGALFSAVTSLFKYVADPYTKLPDIVFWLMGSFAKASMKDVYITAPVLLISMLILYLIRWRLNVLSMGDEEAKTLGIDTNRLRTLVILSATLITASAVCISGLIGWVGLIIPHIGRMLVGPDHKNLVPASILIGASYMLLVDIICRNLTAGEIPVSIVTSIIGAPIFLYLLKKSRENWS
jgi:iron complex transport system permease protein